MPSAMPSDMDDITSSAAMSGPSLVAHKRRKAMLSIRALDTRLAGSRLAEANMNPANLAAAVELLASVEELLRQQPEGREMVLMVGPLQLDLLTRIVKRGERKIDLRPREFCLLEFMMRRKGQVLTRAMLFKEVWNYKFVPESNLVNVHIGRLRSKIDQGGESPMIFTIWGQGFVLREPE